MLKIFEKEKPAAPDQWARDREGDLRLQLRRLDVALADVNRRMREYRWAHISVTRETGIMILSDRLDGRAEIESIWRALTNECESLGRERDAALSELASIVCG